MKRILILILLTIPLFNLAQIHKKFFNKNGREIMDSTKTYNTLLYQMNEHDSTWSAVMVNQKKTPLYKGTYLDEELTIPSGKFVYYAKVIDQEKVDEQHSEIDTLLRIWQSGYYITGFKEGIWVIYWANGNKKSIKTYENDKLNGISEDYYESGRVRIRYNYVKGLREGYAYYFRSDSTLEGYDKYWHDHSIDTKEFKSGEVFYNSYSVFNFDYHVRHYLKKNGIPPSTGIVLTSFTVSAEGKLINPKLEMGVNQILNQGILDAINNSPTWVAARLNGKPVEQNVTFIFKYEKD